MPFKNSRARSPDVCPVCSEAVPRNAVTCPGCGADHLSGWREAAAADGLDLPDESFDYAEFVRNEFTPGIKPAGISTVWWIAAIFVIVVLALIYFFGAR